MIELTSCLEKPQTHVSNPILLEVFIYLFGVLCRFQHCTGHITMGSWKGRGNQYIEFARILYCKLPTNGKQLPAFPFEALPGTESRPQRWEGRVLPLCPLLLEVNNEYMHINSLIHVYKFWNICRLLCRL